MKLLPLCAAAFILYASAPAQGAGKAPAPLVPLSASDQARLDALIQKLGATDFAAREEAQRQLAQTPLSQRDLLAARADKTSDPEIQSRLRRQVDKMDETIALSPPPISLDLKDAPAAAVVDALNKAVGGAFTPPVFDADTFSLKADHQPFWEVMRALSSQHPLWPGPPDGNAFTQLPWDHVHIDRGIALATRGLQSDGEKTVTMTLILALDPRVVVLDLHPMDVADARDELGHLLRLAPEGAAAWGAGARLRQVVGASAQHFQSRDLRFTSAEGLGKTITVSGKVSLLAQVSQTSVTIDAGKHLHEAVAVGDSLVTLEDVLPGEAGANRTGLVLELAPKDSTAKPPAVPNLGISATGISLHAFGTSGGGAILVDSEGSPGGISLGSAGGGDKARIVVTDANGKQVANYAIPHGRPTTSVHIVPDGFQTPLMYTISLPTRTIEAAVPFELKDLPIGP